MYIPYLNSAEHFIGCMNSKYTVEHTTEDTFTGHHITVSPNHTNTSPPTKELLQPEPKKEEKSSRTSGATTAVLHICGYLLVFLSTSYA